ncbi:hypothetical protein DB30_07519 [Enhygromyxa salina]|uniref:Uncharacterized protein n=1 Tax=Enhygromyxa salina TaxID=215803 RepID=A0A0C2CRK1_9BACT|nr:hypothetical protein DB30_07519 [Enhygromyxa salina]
MIACSPNPAHGPGPVAASPAPATLPDGPPPPRGGLPMPSLDLDWSPPSATAGDVAELAQALANHPRVGLLLDPGSNHETSGGTSGISRAAKGLDTTQLAALVGRLAPDTAVHPIGLHDPKRPRLAEVILQDPPLLPATGPTGRTRWALPKQLEVDRVQLQRWAELGDPAVLIVGAVEVDAPVWRGVATSAVGSCEPLLDALVDGQTQSLALLEPFLDHADAVLAAAYTVELARVVPQIEAELAEFEPQRTRADFDADGWARYQCGQSYLRYLQPFSACVSTSAMQTCPMTPRLFLRGSARIGTVEPSEYIPTDCARRMDRDYVEALRAPARAAAELAQDHLDVGWMLLAERLATLSDVHAAIASLCTPARRRFSAPDLAQLRASVAALGPLFISDAPPAHDARFLANDGSFHVPGLGTVRQLARYDGGTDSPSRAVIAAAQQLDNFSRAHARCVPRPGEPPLMTLLVDTRTGAQELLGFFYAEELWCDELGPIL